MLNRIRPFELLFHLMCKTILLRVLAFPVLPVYIRRPDRLGETIKVFQVAQLNFEHYVR
jgi:hypothetical protein